MKKSFSNTLLFFLVGLSICFSGCASKTEVKPVPTVKVEEIKTGIDNESAKDALVDFNELKKENEEIFAWLYVPKTDIDSPILLSWEDDDYYLSHDAHKEPSAIGEAHIPMYNMTDMCDFNTVIYASDEKFKDLANYENPDYFNENRNFYIYLDGNVLTYEVIACFEREKTSLFDLYDFTTPNDCNDFVEYIFGERSMNKQLADGWEDLNCYNFLVTLTAQDRETNKELVVIGALVNDAAGTIDRVFYEDNWVK